MNVGYRPRPSQGDSGRRCGFRRSGLTAAPCRPPRGAAGLATASQPLPRQGQKDRAGAIICEARHLFGGHESRLARPDKVCSAFLDRLELADPRRREHTEPVTVFPPERSASCRSRPRKRKAGWLVRPEPAVRQVGAVQGGPAAPRAGGRTTRASSTTRARIFIFILDGALDVIVQDMARLVAAGG